jgi:hypothetical protein
MRNDPDRFLADELHVRCLKHDTFPCRNGDNSRCMLKLSPWNSLLRQVHERRWKMLDEKL